MLSRMFQSLIQKMKGAIDRTIGVLDSQGNIIACSDLRQVGSIFHAIADVDNGDEKNESDEFTIDGKVCKRFFCGARSQFIVFVEGEDQEAKRYADILSVSLGELKVYYDEKYDRNSFMKNVILDNILPGDIFTKARELQFDMRAVRVCLLAKLVDKKNIPMFDVIQGLFFNKDKDFVIPLNESEVVIVKEVSEGISYDDLEKLAASITDTLSSQYYVRSEVGIGMCVEHMDEIGRSFKEARMAIEVGKVFDAQKNIICYNNLGIARLIYQLPTTLCNTFLGEVFKKSTQETFDHETLFTIQKFFENNLNVSETSRKLFIHRNTLVYRIEKIKRITGLDLRNFEDAIEFKIALMVKKYLSSDPISY